ncbi:MAG: DUF3168 domain-containing protein [Sphingobium sp.]|jgi:hypothetical protein|nr:DUF3168 domain-containing protein [Sphingobium sp.]MCI1270823.1 DUF3168 domain-containing protein [Sphingobium sp.]MCI1756748.1 DUF3168 domain-containing protein [Sphingobium sp.]MCI2052334.1 DUF3168 domain-containing protein [Sphingobium sp.]
MNADADIRAALVSLLQGDAALNAQVNRVYDGEPAKATPPMLVVGDVLGSDWATKDKAGRELRLSLTVEDDRETPARISGIMPLADAAVRGLSGTIGAWRVGSLVMIRSRLVRNGAGRWVAVMDYRVRVLAN